LKETLERDEQDLEQDLLLQDLEQDLDLQDLEQDLVLKYLVQDLVILLLLANSCFLLIYFIYIIFIIQNTRIAEYINNYSYLA